MINGKKTVVFYYVVKRIIVDRPFSSGWKFLMEGLGVLFILRGAELTWIVPCHSSVTKSGGERDGKSFFPRYC